MCIRMMNDRLDRDLTAALDASAGRKESKRTSPKNREAGLRCWLSQSEGNQICMVLARSFEGTTGLLVVA
jgi:hypothetical protein